MVCSVGRRERDDKVRQRNAVRAHSGTELYSLRWPRGAGWGRSHRGVQLLLLWARSWCRAGTFPLYFGRSRIPRLPALPAQPRPLPGTAAPGRAGARGPSRPARRARNAELCRTQGPGRQRLAGQRRTADPRPRQPGGGSPGVGHRPAGGEAGTVTGLLPGPAAGPGLGPRRVRSPRPGGGRGAEAVGRRWRAARALWRQRAARSGGRRCPGSPEPPARGSSGSPCSSGQKAVPLLRNSSQNS